MKKITFAFLILCVMGCSSSNCTKLKLGNETEVQNGNLVCIEGEEYSFIATDDRCPCSISCFWQGEFIFAFENSEGVNIYTHHQFLTERNETPPFADSFKLISSHESCKDQSDINNIIFTVRID